jgi:hypothetical protein
MVAFFIPRASDDEQAERLYDAFAEFAGCTPAPPRDRVRAITFTTDGTEWTAEVGEELHGRRTTRLLRRGEVLEHTETVRSTSRVLAIYPGASCTVVTDGQPITSAPSEWANPFTAEPGTVILFDVAEAGDRAQ